MGLKYKVLTIIVSIIAILILVNSINYLHNNPQEVTSNLFAFFIILSFTLLTGLEKIDLPAGGKVNVLGALFYGGMLIMGKELIVIIILFYTISFLLIGGENKEEAIYYGAIQIIIFTLVGKFYSLFPIFQTLFSNWVNVLIFLAGAFIYLILDTSFYSSFIALKLDLSIKDVWLAHWKEILVFYSALPILGLLFYLSFLSFPLMVFAVWFIIYLLKRTIQLQVFLPQQHEAQDSLRESEDFLHQTSQIKKELERKKQELGILLETSVALSGTLKLEETFQIIENMLQKLIDAQTIIIFIVKEIEGEEQFSVEWVRGPYSEYLLTFKHFSLNPEESLLGFVAKKKESILITDTEIQREPKPLIKYERSEMAAPLLQKDELIGILYMGDSAPHSFNKEDLDLLTTIANQSAIAITNARLYEETHNMAITDGLTKLYTHRYFQERLAEEIKKARYYNSNVSLIMIDTDHFKEYNDTYGHPEGDQLLKEICEILKSYVRQKDVVCRYGGDEFAIILIEADGQTAFNTAERIRQAIQLRLNQREVKITASIGVASFPKDASSKEELIKRVDSALYEAKNKGRNRVCYINT